MALFSKAKKISGWMAVGIEPDALRFAHVIRPVAGLPSVAMAASFPLAKAARQDVLEKAGKELRLADYQCSTVLASGDYQLITVDAPNVPPDELKAAIRWKLKDMLDFHVEDATIDVLDIPPDKNSPARNHSMFAVVARNQVIQDRQAMFGDARLPLKVIDIQETAQRNVSALLEQDGRGLAFLSFGEDGGLLTVSYGGELYLARRIEVRASQFEQQSPEQLNALFERITLELQRSLDHFDRQYHFIAVSKLVLGPMGTAAAGLRDALSANLYVPVEILDLRSVLNLDMAPALADARAQQQYFKVIGAALRHEEKSL
jgi:MSHA biogenesis protein MshI